jgi:hypothetical protein
MMLPQSEVLLLSNSQKMRRVYVVKVLHRSIVPKTEYNMGSRR